MQPDPGLVAPPNFDFSDAFHARPEVRNVAFQQALHAKHIFARARFRQWAAARLTPEDLMPTVEPDALVDLSEVNDRLWLALERIAPFGAENRRPLFAARAVELTRPPEVWQARDSTKTAKHLRVAARQSGRTLMMKGWGMGELAEQFRDVRTADVAFTIERDLWGGWGATVREIRPA